MRKILVFGGFAWVYVHTLHVLFRGVEEAHRAGLVSAAPADHRVIGTPDLVMAVVVLSFPLFIAAIVGAFNLLPEPSANQWSCGCRKRS